MYFWRGMWGTFLQPLLLDRIAVSRALLQNYNCDEKGHVIFFTITSIHSSELYLTHSLLLNCTFRTETASTYEDTITILILICLQLMENTIFFLLFI
jgi:hypothetical protein